MHALIGGQVTAGYGRYIDYFQRFGHAWKLTYRRVVPESPFPATMPRSIGRRAVTTPIPATTA
jgi:hypothetical protein